MLERLKNTNFIKGNAVIGLQVFILPDGNFEFTYVLLNKKKQVIELEKKGNKYISLEAALEGIPVNVPLCLSLDGKGIIHKKVNLINEENENSNLNQIFPNAAPDEFWVQLSEAGGLTYVSVVRIEVVKELLEVLRNNNRYAVTLSLGPFCINNILHIPGISSSLRTNNYELITENSKITDLKKRDNSEFDTILQVGNERIEEEYLTSFSAGFEYFIEAEQKESSLKIFNEHRAAFYDKKLFVAAGWATLVFFLALLLINFFLFSSYSKKYNDYSQQTSQNKELLDKLDTLTKDLKRKEEFISKNGLLNPSRHSYYADRLAITIPQQIVLTELNVNPLIKKLKNEIEPEFLMNTIQVSGLSINSTILNDWVKELNKEKWIKKIVILNYNQEAAITAGEFKIEITLNS